MLNNGKYVIGDIRDRVMGSVYGAVCVSQAISHDSLVPLFVTIEGAGFFNIKDNIVTVHGESVRLKIKSDQKRDLIHVEHALGIVRK